MSMALDMLSYMTSVTFGSTDFVGQVFDLFIFISSKIIMISMPFIYLFVSGNSKYVQFLSNFMFIKHQQRPNIISMAFIHLFSYFTSLLQIYSTDTLFKKYTQRRRQISLF